MIVVDASAVLAILLREDDRQTFEDALAEAGGGVMSSVNYWEVRTRAKIRLGSAGPEVADELLAAAGVRVVACDAELARDAAEAFETYRGRPARLNLGDTFAHALAVREGDGLLYKGNDFRSTDIKSVIA